MLFSALLHVLDPEPHSAAENMAIDEALLATAQAPTLRIYRWARPAVSFGYFTPWAEVERTWPDREAVRRWTGGGIVPHGEDCTYTLVIPRSDPFCACRPIESYRAIHEAIASILPHASLVEGNRPKISAECFANPVAHDVLQAGAKVAGAAQRRTRDGLLHQGSVQVKTGRERWEALLPHQMSDEVLTAPLTSKVHTLASRLVREKYQTANWLHRF